MTGPKTNERPGTRAVLRGYHMSASKARVVLNLIRGQDVNTAREILALTSREAADVVGKVLASAVANAVNNDGQSADELYVSAAFADEGVTMKRFSPRARGRAGKILKRACHITVIVSRLDDDRLEVLRAARSAQATASRSRRVASSRKRADQQASLNKREAAQEAEALEAEAMEAEAMEAENAMVETEVVNDVVVNDAVETTDETTDAVETADETTETVETTETTDETVASDEATEVVETEETEK